MHFHHIPNAAISKEADRPMMQKEVYPVSGALQQYLQQYQKDTILPLTYKELLHYEYTNAIKDDKGKHTHWERVVYEKDLLLSLKKKLQLLYARLKNGAPIEIESIDFCEYANSMPFRINIIQNNRKDLFYIKSADASRIYGLELEQLLSTNPVNFLYHQNTLVEQHIDGTPGDTFLETATALPADQKKLLSAAFIRFNESCFARLLGDMRSYNFVVVTDTGKEELFTIKPIDFDQQCYEGRLNLYLPQFYKENYGYVQMISAFTEPAAIEEIRTGERQKLAALAEANSTRLNSLLSTMARDELSENYKILSLRKELAEYHSTGIFSTAQSMGQLVKQQLLQVTAPYRPQNGPL